MTTSSASTPAGLHKALRTITEHLAHELANSGSAAPQWSEWEWTLARAVSAMHGVAPLLWGALRWRGPAGWTNFLDDQRHHTEYRHGRILRLLADLDAATRGADIAAVALKGAAMHAMGLYSAGERPMADIDLLVRPDDARRTAQILESLDFEESHATSRETEFKPRIGRPTASLGEHGDNDLKIELHERIGERLPWRMADVSQALYPRASSPGLNPYPSPAALLLHVTLHAAGAMTTKSLRLLHLHDLALLTRRMTTADWDRFLEYSGGRKLWWSYPPLQLMLRYFPAAMTGSVLDLLHRECRPVLRQVARRRILSEVSFSHTWVDAFPGIEWCESLTEVVAYASSRIRPGRRQTEWRATARSTELWARHEWSSLSQGRRILRFLTSRQTRPVTMHAITAAADSTLS